MAAAPATPRLLRALLRSTLPVDEQQLLVEDLDDLYATRRRNHGAWSANLWYLRQTIGFLFRVGIGRVSDAVATDAGHALRSFRRRLAFTAAFLITLAVGTGVLATVYAAARWVLVRPVVGVSAPAELVTLRVGFSGAPPHVSFAVSQADLLVFRDRLPVAGALAGVNAVELDVRHEQGDPRRVAGELVTANYFSVLGASLASGRLFDDVADDAHSGRAAVIVSDGFARTIGDGNAREVVGKFLRINGTPVQIIGVAKPGFRGAELPARTDLWLPLAALDIVDPSADRDRLTARDHVVWKRMIARPNTSAATSALESLANRVVEEIRRDFGTAHSFPVPQFQMQAFAGVGLDPGVRQSVKRTLTLLTGAAALLFALAVANLINLSLVQSTLREGAMAIRVALGATYSRITRALLVESLMLGCGGGALAVMLAIGWSRWFQDTRLDERGAPLAGMHVDWVVIALSMIAALVAALVASLGPLRLLRGGTVERILRREAVGTSSTHRTRSTLVAVQMGLTVILLVTAALLGRTVGNLRDIDVGFSPDRLLTFSLDPHLHGYESAALDRLARTLATRTSSVPGASSAAFVSPTPFGSGYFTAQLYATGAPDAATVIGAGYFVSAGFLETMGFTVIAGDRHWQADSGTVVISRSALAKLFPAMTPHTAIGVSVPTRPQGRRPARIAAIIEDVKLNDITADPPPAIIRPLAERPRGMSLSGMVRGTGNPMSMANSVRSAVASTATELPLFGMRSAREAIDMQFAERRAMARTASTLGAIGLLIAAIGLYGVLSNVVAARRREFGIRAAVGASPWRILRIVAFTGLIPVAVGTAGGLGASVWTTRLLSSQLHALERLDPLSYLGATGAMLAATVVACLFPALRALRTSPAEVLREE